MNKRGVLTVGAGFLVGALALLAAQPASVQKLTANLFSVDKDGLTLMADVSVTRLRGGEKYIPMRVWLGKETKGTVYITRASFTVTDPKGVSHPVASVEELRRDYGPNLISADYKFDHRVVESGDQVSSHFADAFNFVTAPVFFANPSGFPSTLRENGEIQLRTYTGTFLYFANPAGKDPGEYKLTFTDPKSGVSLEVPVTIPWSR